ncbi:hypothetical protein ACFFF5_06880 [Lederbergia wuyishanensis]|uniref:Uncharacterized protein n=1 Tax=Lederbergia wuyishanensis TaxID=1347903 RepID=A0ABU0D2K1_9BACI|nr:hypothetical protein [Lederbergia wuyishanensis]MCJ8007213.1 hypothetical protein [Lederbergia wuyishanensis]MDQ0342638.1 hypothetical protein [Lederbergia wuyishanensis]
MKSLIKNICISAILSSVFFLLLASIFDGEGSMTPYFIICIFLGVIIGVLCAIYQKLSVLFEKNN